MKIIKYLTKFMIAHANAPLLQASTCKAKRLANASLPSFGGGELYDQVQHLKKVNSTSATHLRRKQKADGELPSALKGN